MNQEENQLAVGKPAPEPTSPFALTSWDDMDKMAKYVAQSGMFGVTNPAQAICLFAIAQGEGISALAVLKKYHIIEGKPSMRADAMLAEFQKAGGGVIYHARTDSIVAATYFSDRKKIGPEAEKRAIDRMEIMLKLESADDTIDRLGLYFALTKLNREGEQTIVRTLKDAVEKGITQGKDGMKLVWKRYSRAMLAARCDTEGIRIIAPGLISGIMETNEAVEVGEDFRATLPDEQPRREGRDLESMKAILKQYEEEYPEATKQRQKQLQPLMGDLREKISNIERPERLAQAATKPDPKIVDATFEMVEDEPEASAKAPAKPQAQAEAELEEPKPADPATNWKNYRIRHVGGAFKDKLLTEIDIDDLEVLADSMEKKAAKVSGAVYKEEFDMMAEALSERTAEAQGLKGKPAKKVKNPEKEPF
jgi:hypothetical protein